MTILAHIIFIVHPTSLVFLSFFSPLIDGANWRPADFVVVSDAALHFNDARCIQRRSDAREGQLQNEINFTWGSLFSAQELECLPSTSISYSFVIPCLHFVTPPPSFFGVIDS